MTTNATQAEKTKAALEQWQNAEKAVLHYFKSNFRDEGARVFLLSRLDRTRQELHRTVGGGTEGRQLTCPCTKAAQ